MIKVSTGWVKLNHIMTIIIIILLQSLNVKSFHQNVHEVQGRRHNIYYVLNILSKILKVVVPQNVF